MIELVAVQPFVALSDYASEAAFRAKMAALFARVDAVRARDASGAFAHPALVVFPENVGTFLTVAGSFARVRDARTTDAAIARIVAARFPALLRTMLRHRIASPKRAVLVLLASVAWPIYLRTFRDLARAHQAWVVAGSLLAPPNRFGRDAERYEAASGRCYNVSLAFDPDGRVVNETRKVNLVPTLEDVLGLAPGRLEDLAPFDTPLGRVGTMICYDGFHEPHTSREPCFARTGPHFDALGVQILAQPAANPWPWAERWVFAEPGEQLLRREQWLREGLATELATLRHVRYAVNAQLVGALFENRFEGTSYVFERDPAGTVRIVAQSRSWALAPESEEIVYARVERPS